MEDLVKTECNCDRCKRSVHPEEVEPHTCPYKRDIDDDCETLCTCCDYCTEQCADDI